MIRQPVRSLFGQTIRLLTISLFCLLSLPSVKAQQLSRDTSDFWNNINQSQIDSLNKNAGIKSRLRKEVEQKYDSLYYNKVVVSYKANLKNLQTILDTASNPRSKQQLIDYTAMLVQLDNDSHHNNLFESRVNVVNTKIVMAASAQTTAATVDSYVNAGRSELASASLVGGGRDNGALGLSIPSNNTCGLTIYIPTAFFNDPSLDIFIADNIADQTAQRQSHQAPLANGYIHNAQNHNTASAALLNYFRATLNNPDAYIYELAFISFSNANHSSILRNLEKDINWYLYVFRNGNLYYYSSVQPCSSSVCTLPNEN